MFPQLKRVDHIADPDKLVLTPTLRKDLIKGWISKMVVKTKESFSSIWAAPILLAIVLGYNIYSGQRADAKLEKLTESIIVLQTQKEEQEKIHERDRLEFKREVDEQRVGRENSDARIGQLEFIIKNSGRR